MATSGKDSSAATDIHGNYGGTSSLLASLRQSHVSFRMRRLEPLIAGTLALATAWVAAFTQVNPLVIWLGALAALAIAGWGKSFPASHPLLMMARALLLLGIAFALHMDPGSPGPAGIYFFWLPFIACAYALLLSPWLATLLTSLCVGEFVLAAWLSPSPVVLPGLAIHLGMLVSFAVTALLFGRSILQSEMQLEAGLMDPHSRLYNKAGLMLHGDSLLTESLRNGKGMSVVLFNCKDLGDVRELLGREAASRLFSDAVRAIARMAPREGLAARSDRLEFVMLLPGVTSAQAKESVGKLLGTPPRLEISLGDRKVEVVVDVTVGSASRGIDSMEELYDLLKRKLHHRRQPIPSVVDDEPESILQESGGPLSRLELSPTLPMPLR